MGQLDHRNGAAEIGHLERDRLQLVLADVAPERLGAIIDHGGDIGRDREQGRLAERGAVHLGTSFDHGMTEAFEQVGGELQTGLSVGVRLCAVRRSAPERDFQRFRVVVEFREERAGRGRRVITAADLRAMGDVEQGGAVAHAAAHSVDGREAIPAFGPARAHRDASA